MDDVTIKGFYYPDSMTIEGDDSVNLMEMSDESLEKQYSAVLKYGDVLSDADVVWAIESEQQEDIRISDSGVLSANARSNGFDKVITSGTLSGKAVVRKNDYIYL